MIRPTLRFVVPVGLALGLCAANAEAGVGAGSGQITSSLKDRSPVQNAQAGLCWQQNGPDGPGYYPCGGGGGAVVGPATGGRDVSRAGSVPAARDLKPSVPTASPSLRGVHGPTTAAQGAGAAALAGAHPVGEPAGARLATPTPPSAAVPHIAAAPSPRPAIGVAAVPHPSSLSPAPTGAVGPSHIGVPAAPALVGVHGAGAAPAGGVGHR
jgi:hypothetical protein